MIHKGNKKSAGFFRRVLSFENQKITLIIVRVNVLRYVKLLKRKDKRAVLFVAVQQSADYCVLLLKTQGAEGGRLTKQESVNAKNTLKVFLDQT